MNKAFIAIFLAFWGLSLYAQNSIDSLPNAMRDGDVLKKMQIGYVEPGDSGSNQVWELGHYNRQSKLIQQRIISSDDTITVFEAERIHHFFLRNSTLYYKGEQSPRSYVLCDTLMPVLSYPFHFGDSISFSITGRGRDENADVRRTGWGYTLADGVGILTDGIETLYNVLRIHNHEEFTDSYSCADTVHVRNVVDRYAWYMAGCRYPVQESICRTVADGDSLFMTDSQTFLFLPDAQAELPYDPVNELVLQAFSNESTKTPEYFPLSNFQAAVSADWNRLDFSFTLSTPCEVVFVACDVMGNVLSNLRYFSLTSGDWNESITLSRRPVGNTLLVGVRCNEQTMSFKVNR